MKRSGQPKPFRTIGTRMRDFGRSMMRHYVPPQDMPPLVEPPPPAWGAATQTPLVWPEPDAPASFPAEAPPAVGFDEVSDMPQDFGTAPPRRAPQPPAQPSTVQRRPAPPNSVDERLKNILAMHQGREAERNRVREEKKSAFNAAEIQRQADPEAPHRPRRMSVDYVETSALSRGEEPPPSPSVQRQTQPAEASAVDDSQQGGDDTERLDPSVIQASLDTISLQRELSGEAPTFEEEDYIPAGDEDAQAFFDSPPDWSEDSGDPGTPPPIDVPPAPMPPQGSAQRMPDPGDFSEQNEVRDSGSWNAAENEYPYTGEDASEAPPASDMITLSPDRSRPAQRAERTPQAYVADEPAQPDFGGAADFEPTYDDDVRIEHIQRDFESQTAPESDFSTETSADFDQTDAGFAEPPIFDMDESDTRPLAIQRAPVLPPPDFADDMDIPPPQTGYDTLADWVDAHNDEPPPSESQRSFSAQPPGTVQRESEPKPLPIAPDFSLQTGDFNPADFARDAESYLDEDEGDTRRMDVQRSFQESDFAADAYYEPVYPADDPAEYPAYGEQAAPESEGEWGGEVYTSPADSANFVQRDYESAEVPEPGEMEQGYIEPADARPFFAEPGSDEPAGWDGVAPMPADAVNTVQRDYQLPPLSDDNEADTFDLGQYQAAEPESQYEANGDVYTPSAEVDYQQNADNYAGEYEASEYEATGEVYTPPADVSNTVQREYQAPSADADYPQNEDAQAVDYQQNADNYAGEYEASETEMEYEATGEAYTPPPVDVSNTVQREYQAATDEINFEPSADIYADEYAAAETDNEANGEFYPPPSMDAANPIQRDYEMPSAEAGDEQNADVYAGEYEAAETEYESSGEVYTPPSDSAQDADGSLNPTIGTFNIQRDYELPPLPDDDDAEPAPYDEQPPANPWGGDDSPANPSQTIQRDYESRTAPTPPDAPDGGVNAYGDGGYDVDAGYPDAGDQPVDLYQAMMGAGMIPPDAGWNGGDANLSPGFIQRTPDMDDDTNIHAPDQPVDVFQAMMQAGMVQPAPDDYQADTYYPPDADTSMSEATRADLLSLLDMPAPRGRENSTSDFTPDMSLNQPGSIQHTVSRTFQPPPAEPPPMIQRAETQPEDEAQNDVNVDQLARDVYSVLRNRLRIERERRDRKP
ncbi:MAG: hypothetical protein ABI690_14945 [Chloroflexota bacterium]